MAKTKPTKTDLADKALGLALSIQSTQVDMIEIGVECLENSVEHMTPTNFMKSGAKAAEKMQYRLTKAAIDVYGRQMQFCSALLKPAV